MCVEDAFVSPRRCRLRFPVRMLATSFARVGVVTELGGARVLVRESSRLALGDSWISLTPCVLVLRCLVGV